MAYSINENHLHIVTNYVEGPTLDKLLFDVAKKVYLIFSLLGAFQGYIDTGFPGDISTCA